MIDWSKPIEAVHEDGRVVAGQVDQPNDGLREFSSKLDGMKRLFDGDGSGWSTMHSWRVRNAPEHPTPTQYAPELVERMVALARRVAASEPFWVEEVEDEARSIVSDLPQEVDQELVEAEAFAYENNHLLPRDLVLAAFRHVRQFERGDAA